MNLIRERRSWLLFACFSLMLLVSLIDGYLPSKVMAGIDKVDVITGNVQEGFGCKRVTLVTGDVVIVSELPGKQIGIAVVRADPNNAKRGFQRITNSKGTYVIPTDISLDKLDIELFNVEYLAKEEYDKMKNLPVMVTTFDVSMQAEQSITKDIQAFNGRVKASFKGISTLALDLPTSTLGKSVQSLLERPYVKKIWLDKKVHACLSDSVPLIGGPELWNSGYNGSGIEIAIIDTGIDCTHPDLDDLDDNPNTYDPKVIRKVNFSSDNTTDDLRGHGTHCAGIAAGTGALSGGKNRGVAPGAKLWNVKVLNQYGWGEDSWVISGIDYAAYGPDGIAHSGDEADVISMSLGGDPTDGSDPASLAADRAVRLGVVVVIAAGNGENYLQVGSPGDAKQVITVGASTKQDEIAVFSSRGPTLDYRVKPDVLAPGVFINSTVPRNLTGTYYQLKSGTSMAAPHVAGCAALMLQACKTLPAGLSINNYIKDMLISTAKDLGYDVYTQGGGRIQVPCAASTDILADPATISFCDAPKQGNEMNATVTFYNLNATSDHVLNLTMSVTDFAGNVVNCAGLNATVLCIAPNSKAAVFLAINTSCPSSLYSGRIYASIDGKTSVQVIFGIAKMNHVTIILKDKYGNSVQDRSIYVIGDPGIPDFSILGLYPSENVTLSVLSGTYYVFGYRNDPVTNEPIWTLADNVSINSDIIITLDEGRNFKIDFNPNKANQIMADRWVLFKHSTFIFESGGLIYPGNTAAYVSATKVPVSFSYCYYPKAYYNASDRWSLNTPEWHNLVYGLEEVSKNVTFTADYNNLVQRTTDYKMAEQLGTGNIIQWVGEPNTYWHGSSVFNVDLPQRRIEWLCPSPASHIGIYGSPQTGLWITSPLSYAPKSRPYIAFGEHPFVSGLSLNFAEENFTIGNALCADTSEDEYRSAGDLAIFSGGVQVFSMTVKGWFLLTVHFHGILALTIVARSYGSPFLSKNTITELSFTTDFTRDCQPPKIKMKVKGSDMGCRVPQGEVSVNVTVTDENLLTSTSLEYSIDDGKTWAKAIVRDVIGDTYQYSLRTIYDNTYVSLRFNATDSMGNRISQTTFRGLVVRDLGNLNGDRKVDGKDLAIAAKAYNTKPGQPLWDLRADTNLDHEVDGLDIAVVVSHYGRAW